MTYKITNFNFPQFHIGKTFDKKQEKYKTRHLWCRLLTLGR